MDSALRYAARGWPIIPLHTPDENGRCSCRKAECQSVGKHPRTANGLNDATTNEFTIRRWWDMWPEANVGIAAGEVSGLLVLDVDPRHGGDESLEALTRQHAQFPLTREVLTGGDGRHIYFQRPETERPIRNSAGKLGDGLDVRAEGGYIVAPPSLHASGRRYEWTNEEITPAPAPEWVVRLLAEKKQKKAASETAGERVREGQRNTTLASLAGGMRRAGMSLGAIEAALLKENEGRCEPPLSEEEVRAVAASISRYDAGDANDDGNAQQSQATRLVALAEDAELFRTPEGTAYATVRVSGHGETWPLKSTSFRNWLARRFYEGHKKAAPSQAVSDALGVLEGKALFEGETREVHTRIAEQDGAIYLDLCDPEWRAVKITGAGWRIVENPPVRFRRAKAMLPLPPPERGGSIAELEKLINVPGEERALVLAWLVMAFRPKGPYPVLVLHGEQGSAKSTTARVLCDLVDPNSAALRSEPRGERDLMIAATNRRLVAFDNLSRIQEWLSDSLCRLATGGGFAARALYTDEDEKIFDAQRPIMLTGIEELATRSDLLDRSLIVHLPAIPEESRRLEAEVWREFEGARPRILGAVLDAVSAALRNEGSVKLGKLPRMADFAKWATAAEQALGLKAGEFMDAYNANREAANKLAVEASLVAPVVLRFMSQRKQWEGTAKELLFELTDMADMDTSKLHVWPKTAQGLSGLLKRLAPNLRREGVDVQQLPRKSDRRLIRLERVAV